MSQRPRVCVCVCMYVYLEYIQGLSIELQLPKILKRLAPEFFFFKGTVY